MKKFNFKNINLKKYFDFFIKGVYAGIMIAIGGIAYLALDSKVMGSFLFSIGLLTVCMYGLNLYTGKIGYILINKLSYIWELLLSLIGNFVGTFLVGNVMRYTRYENYIEIAQKLVEIKLNDNLISIFILSMFCGVMMYIAVNNFKHAKDMVSKYIGIFMCVMVFILCGFEHCVANMFYFSIASIWNLDVFLYLIIMILGNSIGSIIIAIYYNRFYKN